MMRRMRKGRGFTLVELMVALTGGLFVTAAVFVLSKQATQLYQSEARLSNATLGSIVGFERLRTDIERAGYLTTPNLLQDPKVCGVPDTTWPGSGSGQFLRHLSSVFVDATATGGLPLLAANHIAPDEITLAGSYASADQFDAEAIEDNGTNVIVTLQSNSPALARLGGYPTADAPTQTALLQSVFAPKRILRIVDDAAREEYGVIQATTNGPSPKITLVKDAPRIERRESSALRCGVKGVGARHLVNVVNLIRYSLKDMKNVARYSALFSTGVTTDTGRTELVREELNADGTIAKDAANNDIQEIVTEFAVDLSFSLVSTNLQVSAGQPTQETSLSTVAGTDRSAWVGPVWANSPSAAGLQKRGPQLVRAVRARLSVRSREADRMANVATFGDGGALDPVMGGVYRFGVTNGAAPFARVRTVQADMALRNHRGVTWF